MRVGIACRLEFLVIVGIGVELRPHADHQTAVHRVDVVHHLFGIGIARLIEDVAPPLVVFPVLPVLDDVVDRDVAAAEFGERPDHFILRGIALPALPEAQHPFGHHRGLTGQLSVAADHTVIVATPNQIIVRIGLEFTPETDMILQFRVLQRCHTKADIRHVAVGPPFDPDGRPDTLFQVHRKLVAVRIPGRTPAARHHFLPADRRLLKACIILDEIVVARLRGLDPALIDHFRAVERNLGQVLDHELVFIIERIFPLHQRLALGRDIGARQCTFHAVFVVEYERFAQLLIWFRITPAAERIGIEEQAVTLVRNHKRNANLRVVLEKFLVPVGMVELTRLVLTQTIEGLRIPIPGFEQCLNRPGLLSIHCNRLKTTFLNPGNHKSATPIQKPDITGIMDEIRIKGDEYLQRICRYAYLSKRAIFLHILQQFYLEIRKRLLRHDDQALPVVEFSVWRNRYPDDFRRNHLKTYCPVLAGNEHQIAFHGIGFLAGYQQER